MARQNKYPDYYPTDPSLTPRQASWDFVFGNQHKAPEMVIVYLEAEFTRLENIIMARATAKKKTNVQNAKATWTGFANIDLSAKDKDAIRGGLLDGDRVLEIFHDMLAMGHKVSLNYDPDRDTVSCAVTGAYERCPNAGLTMTSFGADIVTAMMVAAYKHEIVAKGNWSSFVSRKPESEDFG